MKKLIPILLSLVLVLALFPAREAGADYKNGEECPHKNDGKLVVEPSSSDASQHKYYCDTCDFGATEAHWGGEATCTSGPVCKGCGAVYGSALGHKPGSAVKEKVTAATCNEGGSYDEVVYCSVCGKEISRKSVKVDNLGHDWQRWDGHETITRMYFKCTRCGGIHWEHNSETWNMKWDFVRYANGEHVKYYKAYSTGPDYNGTLTVEPLWQSERDDTDEIGLYMTPDDVYVWVWENENRIELVRDDATLALDPREITPEMFGLKEEDAPDYYVFSLTPAEDGGWLVKAEALKGEERIPALELKRITLTLAGKETEITENGVYKAE